MNDLSLTQKYLLCTLGRSGRFSTYDSTKVACFAAAGVVELLLDGVVLLDGKKLSVRTALPASMEYLRPVYGVIEAKQPVKFEKVLESFTLTLTDRLFYELLDGVGRSLEAAGCVKADTGRRGLFGRGAVYVPQRAAVDSVVQNIRAELLEDGELSEDIGALTALLGKCGGLARFFSAYEKQDLNRRLREISRNPQNAMVQKAVDYIDTLLVAVIVAST